MKIEMTWKKDTKNTHVYVALGTAVPTLYINKSAFDEKPMKITVIVEIE